MTKNANRKITALPLSLGCAKIVLLFFCTLAVMCVSPSARAQSDTTQSDFGAFGGYMLPSQIQNVSEILPLFGARYALNFSTIGLEFEGENAHAKGIDWTQASMSLRAIFPLDPGIDATIYLGPDILWYIPNGDTERRFDYGIHAGIGGLFQVKDSLWLRGDLKFLANPGTSLYFLVGLMWRPNSTSGGSQ